MWRHPSSFTLWNFFFVWWFRRENHFKNLFWLWTCIFFEYFGILFFPFFFHGGGGRPAGGALAGPALPRPPLQGGRPGRALKMPAAGAKNENDWGASGAPQSFSFFKKQKFEIHWIFLVNFHDLNRNFSRQFSEFFQIFNQKTKKQKKLTRQTLDDIFNFSTSRFSFVSTRHFQFFANFNLTNFKLGNFPPGEFKSEFSTRGMDVFFWSLNF